MQHLCLLFAPPPKLPGAALQVCHCLCSAWFDVRHSTGITIAASAASQAGLCASSSVQQIPHCSFKYTHACRSYADYSLSHLSSLYSQCAYVSLGSMLVAYERQIREHPAEHQLNWIKLVPTAAMLELQTVASTWSLQMHKNQNSMLHQGQVMSVGLL